MEDDAMRLRWVWVPLLLLSLTVRPVTARAGSDYLADLVGGMNSRSGASASQARFDSPGSGLRIDFGRELGAGISLIGSLGWTRLVAGKAEQCIDCVQTDSANTLVLGLNVRYNFPLSRGEVFLQGGIGYLFDILRRSGGLDGQPPVDLKRQFVFQSCLGMGFRIFGKVFLGGRIDSRIGSGLTETALGGYLGVRFQ
jgi:hypothetical protein